ncbi:MAG: zinc ribbon domain-containing protein [Planctomycetaceae bacterium]
MELPKCPSCGQSVLDDDAQDCPFCGSPMKGPAVKKAQAKPGTSPSAPPVKPGTSAKPEPDSDDPFAIAQNPAGGKVIPCAPKPMKGRLHRVVCPMCDTQGFVPKAAVGHQVRCANKDCLVPLFTAPADADEAKKPRTPTRMNEEEPRRKKVPADPGAPKNPMVMYGIVGGVLLVLTLGLVAWLNQPAPTHLGPANIPLPVAGDDDPDEDNPQTPVKPPQDTPETTNVKAADLLPAMIQVARITSGNRDKAFCRRLTGDTALRLGLTAEAQAEFAQMAKISSSTSRDTKYYQIAPLVEDFWRLRTAGKTADADSQLKKAAALSDGIPGTGVLAIESGISLAAALAETGDVPAATAVVEGLQRDQTLATQIDAVRLGVWLTLATSIQEDGRRSPAPDAVFLWNEPLLTATGLELALHRRWETAVAWATSLKNPLTVSDTLAAITAEAVAVKASDATGDQILTAAAAHSPETQLRVLSLLAQNSNAANRWQAASAALPAAPENQAVSPDKIQAVLDSDVTKTAATTEQALALAEFAIAAMRHGDEATAIEGIGRLYATLVSEIAPTTALRKASAELQKDEQGVRRRVAEQLGLSDDNQIRSRYLSYRRNIDRLSAAAEDRRLLLIRCLVRIVDQGGLKAVKAALKENDAVMEKEVCLDDLKQLLDAAVIAAGHSSADIPEDHPEHVQRLQRTEPIPEIAAATSIGAAWGKYSETGRAVSITELENSRDLYGLRAAHAAFLAELAAKKQQAKPLIEDLAQLKDELWREGCLSLAAFALTENGHSTEVSGALTTINLSPTQRLLAMHAMARALLRESQP